MASYRYRVKIPAWELGAKINDLDADIFIFAKPQPAELELAYQLRSQGKIIIADFCDDHFERFPQYGEFTVFADAVTACSKVLADKIEGLYYRPVTVIGDPYEYPEVGPHVGGANLLWFGHAVNKASLAKIMPVLVGYDLRIIGNFPGSRPWSHEGMLTEFLRADVVVLPATAPYKTCNRAVEAVRQGCFVVAEPHPSLENFPGIWIGDIKEGVEWATKQENWDEVNRRTRQAQLYVQRAYTPRIQADAWRSLLEKVSALFTSGAEISAGQDGSMLTTSMERT